MAVGRRLHEVADAQTAGERWWPRFSLLRVFVWVGITVLAFVFGWLAAVAFVSACSLYANIASDFSAWRSDRNPALDRIETSLLEVADRLAALEERAARDA